MNLNFQGAYLAMMNGDIVEYLPNFVEYRIKNDQIQFRAKNSGAWVVKEYPFEKEQLSGTSWKIKKEDAAKQIFDKYQEILKICNDNDLSKSVVIQDFIQIMLEDES